MKVLLDTHILLWWLADDEHLPAPAAVTIAQAQIEGFTLVSVDRRFSDYEVELLLL